MEEIIINNLVHDWVLDIYKPLSCMTICDEKEPIMIVSAFSLWPRQYVIAIDLNENNSLLWKVKIASFG
jgi:hypothetical protein